VLLVATAGVGASGVPVRVGDAEKTLFPVPVAPVAVTPPIEMFVPKL
jgi:hypothetical protein